MGMRDYLNHVHGVYSVDSIYVTEFGVDEKNESNKPLEEALKDEFRQEYYKRYMKQIALAKEEDSVPVNGIFAWSLLDNFEWGDGLNFRFGITYVDFTREDLKRYPKNSSWWWTNLIADVK